MSNVSPGALENMVSRLNPLGLTLLSLSNAAQELKSKDLDLQDGDHEG